MGGCDGQVAVSGEGTEQCVLRVQGSSCEDGCSVAELVLHDLHVRSNSTYQCSSAHMRKLSSVSCPVSQLWAAGRSPMCTSSRAAPGLAGAA